MMYWLALAAAAGAQEPEFVCPVAALEAGTPLLYGRVTSPIDHDGATVVEGLHFVEGPHDRSPGPFWQQKWLWEKPSGTAMLYARDPLVLAEGDEAEVRTYFAAYLADEGIDSPSEVVRWDLAGGGYGLRTEVVSRGMWLALAVLVLPDNSLIHLIGALSGEGRDDETCQAVMREAVALSRAGDRGRDIGLARTPMGLVSGGALEFSVPDGMALFVEQGFEQTVFWGRDYGTVADPAPENWFSFDVSHLYWEAPPRRKDLGEVVARGRLLGKRTWWAQVPGEDDAIQAFVPGVWEGRRDGVIRVTVRGEDAAARESLRRSVETAVLHRELPDDVGE